MTNTACLFYNCCNFECPLQGKFGILISSEATCRVIYEVSGWHIRAPQSSQYRQDVWDLKSCLSSFLTYLKDELMSWRNVIHLGYLGLKWKQFERCFHALLSRKERSRPEAFWFFQVYTSDNLQCFIRHFWSDPRKHYFRWINAGQQEIFVGIVLWLEKKILPQQHLLEFWF